MSRQYPERPHSHVLEAISQRFFESHLPKSWTCHKHPNDYGIDLIVEIFEDNLASSLEFIVQLKSSQHGSKTTFERISLKVSTFNYLRNKLQVVMLVQYVADDDEAYWVLLKDVPEPNKKQKTFTVRLRKENTLSTIEWGTIQEYVRQVQNGKLDAWRAR